MRATAAGTLVADYHARSKQEKGGEGENSTNGLRCSVHKVLDWNNGGKVWARGGNDQVKRRRSSVSSIENPVERSANIDDKKIKRTR